MKIGIDFGGVCSSKADDYENDNKVVINKDGIRSISMPGCLEALTELSKVHELYLISFCGAKRAKETGQYLQRVYPDLFKELYFVKKRTFKNGVCKYLGIDVMIDDRLDVLETITDAYCIHFKGDPLYIADHVNDNSHYNGLSANNWQETVEMIAKLESRDNVPDNNALKIIKIYPY